MNASVPTEYGAYRLLKDRIPEFDEHFSPHDGWSVQIDIADPLSLKPGLQALYLKCIETSRPFKQAGLPALPNPAVVVFVAKLIDKEGRVIRTASTHQHIEYLKDFERAETRARQRLVAACGFDGASLDADELQDLAQPDLEDLSIDFGSESVDHDLDNLEPTCEPTTEAETSEAPSGEPDASAISPAVKHQVDTLVSQLNANGTDFQYPTTTEEALAFVRQWRNANES